MPTWQFFHITTKVGRSSLTFLLPTTGHPLPEPADYSVPTIDHIGLTGWLCSMLFHVLPRFYGLVIAKKWAQKLAPSQSLLAAAAHYHTVVPNVKNPPKNNFAQGDFTRFSMEVSANSHNFRFQLPALHIQNLQAQV